VDTLTRVPGSVFAPLLATSGVTKWADGPKRALLSLVLRRLWIRLRDLEFTEPSGEQYYPDAELARNRYLLDGGRRGLGVVDLIRGAELSKQSPACWHWRAGEIYSRCYGPGLLKLPRPQPREALNRRQALQLADRTERLAVRTGNPHAIGLAIWPGA